MVRLASVWFIYYCLSLTYATPVVSPPGFNASEDVEGEVVFKCLAVGSKDLRWLINGTVTTGPMLESRGIFLDETAGTENETTYIKLNIRPTAENDNTSVQCRVVFANDTVARSSEVLFRVQGPLSPPTNLSTINLNSTHDYLVWEDPPTLDLTDQDPDITGYTVSLLMKQPPYVNCIAPLADLVNYCGYNFSVSSTNGRQFPVLRYGSPVRFRVSAWNPAGQGEASQYHVIEPPSGCVRIKDMVSPDATGTVTMNGLHLFLEILLFQTRQEIADSQIGYCYDYLVVEIRDSHDGSLSSQHVLLPTVKEDRMVYLKMESCLESDGHFTALVYFNSSLLTQTNFSTFDIQNVLISTLPDGLAVECQFAIWSATNTCSVVLLLEGELIVEEEIDSQTTFSELRSGHYTVLVYESSVSESGSGEPPRPAVERTVTVGTVTSTPHPTPTLEDEATDKSLSDVVLAFIFGFVMFLAVVTSLLVGACLVMVRRHKRSQEYSVKKRELANQPSVASVFPETGQEKRYSQTPARESLQICEDPAYEDIDRKRAPKKESKPVAVPTTQQEPQESIANHTYSTVNKIQSSKKVQRQDSSPPPVPPQTFTEDYAQEFLRKSQLLEEEIGRSLDLPQDRAGQQTGQIEDSLHVYDSLHPVAHLPSHADTQIPPAIPPKAGTKYPIYESIKSAPSSSPTPSIPSPPHSPTDEADTSALIQQSPQRPPSDLKQDFTVNTAPHPQPHRQTHPHCSLTHLPANGSHHSLAVTSEVTSQSQAPPSIRRPQSMNVHQYIDSEHSIQLSFGRRMSSMPLLSSDLQDDV